MLERWLERMRRRRTTRELGARSRELAARREAAQDRVALQVLELVEQQRRHGFPGNRPGRLLALPANDSGEAA